MQYYNKAHSVIIQYTHLFWELDTKNFCFQIQKNHITRNMNMCQELHLKIFENIHLSTWVPINSNLKDYLISNLLNLECLAVAFLLLIVWLNSINMPCIYNPSRFYTVNFTNILKRSVLLGRLPHLLDFWGLF